MNNTNRRLSLPSAIGLAFLVAACGSGTTSTATSIATSSTASTPTRPSASTVAGTGTLTASCTAPAVATTAQTDGPYYKAGAPQVTTLVQSGMAGSRFTLTGYVLTTDCTPIANASVNIWQADATGTYDNTGYTLRGYLLTDASGHFAVETIVPGEYPGRTEHIHVKVTPPGGPTLTTQLYFPGVTANDSDGIYSPDLLLKITQSGNTEAAAFTFVLAA